MVFSEFSRRIASLLYLTVIHSSGSSANHACSKPLFSPHIPSIGGEPSMTDLELFARLIQCEAGGEGDNGMKAVASVVMNRVRTSVGGIRALQYHPRRHLSGRSVQLRPHKAIRPDEPAKRLQYESDKRSLRNCGMGDGGRAAGESLGSAFGSSTRILRHVRTISRRAWGIFKSALAITAFTIQRRRMPIPDGKTALAVRGVARRIPSRKDCRRKTF